MEIELMITFKKLLCTMGVVSSISACGGGGGGESNVKPITFPEAGTVISTRCDDVNLIEVIANGSGGTTDQITLNSEECGYVNPDASDGPSWAVPFEGGDKLPTVSYVISETDLSNDLYDLIAGTPAFDHNYGGAGSHSFNIVDDPDGSQNDSVERYELRTGDCTRSDCDRRPPYYRAESSSAPVYGGETRWYAWSMYISEDFDPIGGVSAAGWKPNIALHQQLMFDSANNKNWTPHYWIQITEQTPGRFVIQHADVWDPYNVQSRMGNTVLMTLDEAKGKWIYFVEKITWSNENFGGEYQLYVNGKRIINQQETMTLDPDYKLDSAYAKWGIYRPQYQSESKDGTRHVQVVYFDDIRDGNTYEDIAY